MEPPSHSLLCEWIKAVWESLPVKMIKKSFLTCAITTAVDGSDDDNIHCFKPGQPCNVGRNELRKQMDKLTDQDTDKDDDPFASDIDVKRE